MQGWLRKRPRFGGHWPLRFFVLENGTLFAYSSDKTKADELHPLIPTHVYRLNAPGLHLSVTEPFEKNVRTAYNAPFKDKVFAIRVFHDKDTLILSVASPSLDEMRKWKAALEQATKSKLVSSPSSATLVVNGPDSSIVIEPAAAAKALKPRPKSVLPDNWGEDDHFRVVELTTEGVSIEGQKVSGEFPSMRAKAVVDGSSDTVFKVLMDDSRRTQWDQGISSCVVLKKVSEQCHIVRLETRAFWVGPVETDPRDLVLLRYWRKEDEAQPPSFVITWQSVEDASLAAPREGFVRGKIFSMSFAITPSRTNPDKQSTVRVTCHADPGGSLAYMPGAVQQQWLYPFVSRVIGLQKYLSGGGELDTGLTPDKTDDDAAFESERNLEASAGPDIVAPIAAEDEPNTWHFGTFPHAQWGQTPSAEPFRVRGKTYLSDNIKVVTGRSMFHLVAFDLNLAPEPQRIAAARSDSPLRALQKQFPPSTTGRQVFCLNFIMPGPPYYLLAAYALSKPGVLDPATPFGRLWSDFVEGTDEYRNSVFKIIPRVTKGSYVVRKTVGETPALIGRKIDITWHVGPGFVEADIELGTSAVAASVLSVFKSYATALTADLAFTLEGHSEDELPEEIFFALRFLGPDLRAAKPMPDDPDKAETERMKELVMQAKRGEVKRKSGKE